MITIVILGSIVAVTMLALYVSSYLPVANSLEFYRSEIRLALIRSNILYSDEARSNTAYIAELVRKHAVLIDEVEHFCFTGELLPRQEGR